MTKSYERQTAHEGELSDRWSEVYYGESSITHDGSSHRLIKALYEDRGTGLKVAVYPRDSMDIGGQPTHQVSVIQPIYSSSAGKIDPGLVFLKDLEAVMWVLRSIVPEVEQTADGAPELNKARHQEKDDISYRLSEEDDFSKWDKFPQAALDELETFKNYPLNYSYIYENLESLSAIARIERQNPDLLTESIDEPLPAQIIVEETSSGDKEFTLNGESIKQIHNLSKHIQLDQVDPNRYETGCVLADVELRFNPERVDRRGLPLPPFVIHEIDYTDEGRDIRPTSPWRWLYRSVTSKIRI